ncbi:DgyrCDS13849 [Dimorphilus gyrociliatus]|uniref:DgyrCDS13849 n=1 Tax=Dimorphilus gyrociliatus TaxID=2664684 RepID=A0A7I8WBZ8_9ANNE|nr:DgyrCDS13849 [Dimorphilus gyrociliatus]
MIHEDYNEPASFSIDSIHFGTRQLEGSPLVYESLDWQLGVYVGASFKSQHTRSGLFEREKPGRKMPKVFHVNWFREDPKSHSLLWPGFGENIRVLDWICRRVDGEDICRDSPIGKISIKGSIKITNLENVDEDKLHDLNKE